MTGIPCPLTRRGMVWSYPLVRQGLTQEHYIVIELRRGHKKSPEALTLESTGDSFIRWMLLLNAGLGLRGFGGLRGFVECEFRRNSDGGRGFSFNFISPEIERNVRRARGFGRCILGAIHEEIVLRIAQWKRESDRPIFIIRERNVSPRRALHFGLLGLGGLG